MPHDCRGVHSIDRRPTTVSWVAADDPPIDRPVSQQQIFFSFPGTKQHLLRHACCDPVSGARPTPTPTISINLLVYGWSPNIRKRGPLLGNDQRHDFLLCVW